jgi:hypothetical protein
MKQSPPQKYRIMSNEINLPKPYCAALCRNAMSEMCIEACTSERKGKWFALKDIDIADMPRFPIDEFINGMTPDERKIILAAYTAKLVDQAQGRTNERKPIIRRCHPNHSRTVEVSQDQQGEVVLFSAAQEVASLEAGTEYQGADERPSEVVDGAG